jgi:hypothetical protein
MEYAVSSGIEQARYTDTMLAALRFVWNATRGHRMFPWRSPYIRWRIETYSGMHAETLTAADVVRFTWRERKQLLHFLQWTGEIAALPSTQDEHV